MNNNRLTFSDICYMITGILGLIIMINRILN